MSKSVVLFEKLSSPITKGPGGSDGILRIHENVCEFEAAMSVSGWNVIEKALAPTEKVELQNRPIRCYDYRQLLTPSDSQKNVEHLSLLR